MHLNINKLKQYYELQLKTFKIVLNKQLMCWIK